MTKAKFNLAQDYIKIMQRIKDEVFLLARQKNKEYHEYEQKKFKPLNDIRLCYIIFDYPKWSKNASLTIYEVKDDLFIIKCNDGYESGIDYYISVSLNPKEQSKLDQAYKLSTDKKYEKYKEQFQKNKEDKIQNLKKTIEGLERLSV